MSNVTGLTIRQFLNEWLENNRPSITEEGLMETASRPGTDETNWIGLIYVDGVEVRYFDIKVDPETAEIIEYTIDRR